MTTTIGAAQARANLSALMAKAAHGGERIIVARRGKPYAAPVGLADAALIERGRAPSARPQGALTLVGTWSEASDRNVDQLVADIHAQRAGDLGRPGDSRPDVPAGHRYP